MAYAYVIVDRIPYEKDILVRVFLNKYHAKNWINEYNESFATIKNAQKDWEQYLNKAPNITYDHQLASKAVKLSLKGQALQQNEEDVLLQMHACKIQEDINNKKLKEILFQYDLKSLDVKEKKYLNLQIEEVTFDTSQDDED